MNKEVSLKDRIEKLYESGYVNEFNYLESQLQEARYLVTILHKQTEEKGKEIDRLNNIISKTSKDIQHELSHLKANDEISWNEEFYTNNKLDYRKLCIALLEQFVNKLKEKE